eukprot:TRINITY_DN10024_c0_g1_i1.p1 TRINITY_DN10024_c0_g1~~TRINITY_DN10024_c0_g1_i1.p1  ORF type:complete len:342 (-),score=56.12 TRINITY_DN10024_c0_g1_i1:67-1092(-)
MKFLLVALLALFSICFALNVDSGVLPLLKVNPKYISVGGLSSGAFFAHQFHVAFSESLRGASIVAGGPYYCANNNVEIALESCMTQSELIVVEELLKAAEYAEVTLTVDALYHLLNSKVFLFSGSKDTTVEPGVVHKVKDFYKRITVGKVDIKTVFDVPAEHSMVTESIGNDCDYLGSPYINKCGYNLQAAAMSHILDAHNTSNVTSLGNVTQYLHKFDQRHYIFGPFSHSEIGMFTYGRIFVPPQCEKRTCKMHIELHGCHQSIESIGEQYVLENGLNEHAMANGIIILYPQAQSNVLNPNGCWDWWGYTGEAYATRLGYQMRTVADMASRVAGKKFVVE